ncbi:zeta-crystallin-like isoform X1 [Lingula anatina]|uniref:Zeta-crystallin-like isoform X1 n=1 Tax=Lingula anatina TaxID=7574 RepID=A0A1S3JJT1_LINAN|nr:zeta-crystallin-like isoform X2 [Lingula anatina]XP_023932491.1 zeta-crystallin-like isoform X1 [Lingula anatina]XP_023932492.1 zeta-crystallin-like isoform X1 [Lingula anatina]|eukprot:XP_013410163.1 zeta-crystallin-like isoform X2 [Lingula anatina]
MPFLTRGLMAQVMRAIRVNEFGGPEVLVLAKDVPIPKPGKCQVLIKVAAAGINPVDTYIRTGTHTVKPPLPYTPGMDVSGIVEELGEEVTKFKKGDHVYTVRTASGGYAEYAVADDRTTFKLHKNLEFTQGACVGVPYFTAYRALVIRGSAKPGETVLVHGASGGVGLAACQIAKNLGLQVIGTASTAEGLHLVKENGAHHAFNHKEEGYLDKIKEATDGKGVDIILEMLANVNLPADTMLCKKHGRILIIGNRGSCEINPRQLMTVETSVIGVMLMVTEPHEWEMMGSFMYAGMEQGWLKPVVHRKYDLKEAPQAHIDVISNQGSKGNLVLQI